MNEEDTQEVMSLLSDLQPTAVDAPRPAVHALAQIKQQLKSEETMTWKNRLQQFFATPGRRNALATGLALFLFVFAFSFPSVRAAGTEFLSLFRVQNFAAITISPEQIAVLSKIEEEGLTPGEMEIFEDPGVLTSVDSIGEAATRTSLAQVRSISKLGEPEMIYVSAPGGGRLTIDLEGSRAILEAAGVDPLLLPDNLDGAQVDVTVFAGVEQQWGDDLHLLQSESPVVDYPDGLDTAALGQALLQVLGLDEAEAKQLAQEIDWTSTLLLPIPQDVATYQAVMVDGANGMAVNSLDGSGATIIWQKDGVLYTLIGKRSVEELVELANSVE